MHPESTIGATLLFGLDLIWPFCGFRPFRRHDLFGGRQLTVIAEQICRRCGRRWMIHSHYDGTVPWSGQVEAFFKRHMEEEREWRRKRADSSRS